MTAILSSNRGDAQFVVELGAPAEYALDAGYESSIQLRGQHWDGDHEYPFSTSIDGLWLRAAELIAIQNHISRWVHQAIDRLIAEELNAEFQLTRLPGQDIYVRFGPRANTISDEKPVFSISFAAGTFKGEFHFVTDQSCLALFAEELSTEMERTHQVAG